MEAQSSTKVPNRRQSIPTISAQRYNEERKSSNSKELRNVGVFKKLRAYKLRALVGWLSGPLASCSSGRPSPSTPPGNVPLGCLDRSSRLCGHHRLEIATPPLTPPESPLHTLRRDGTMLRQTLARSAWRTGKHPARAARAFSATAQRPAEVELTIGVPLLRPARRCQLACRAGADYL